MSKAEEIAKRGERTTRNDNETRRRRGDVLRVPIVGPDVLDNYAAIGGNNGDWALMYSNAFHRYHSMAIAYNSTCHFENENEVFKQRRTSKIKSGVYSTSHKVPSQVLLHRIFIAHHVYQKGEDR